MSRALQGLLTCTIITLSSLFTLVPCLAASDQDMIVLKLTLDASLAGAPPPVVYVDGNIAGHVPGLVEVPVTSGGAAIEIGIPQLSALPLYSVYLTPYELDREIAPITYTDIQFDTFNPYDIWAGASLQETTQEELEITREDNFYRIDLPKNPYGEIAEFWRDNTLVETTS